MMKKIKVYLATILVLSFIVGTNVSAATVVVSLNQQWSSGFSVARTKAYSYVSTRCESVHPITAGATDNFTKIQANLKDTNGTIIGESTVVLTEGGGYSSINIKDGYLNLSSVNIVYRGNDPAYAAEAVVYYYSN